MNTSSHAEQLLLQIREAFHGIELGNGVSLHQALVIDDYGSHEEQQAARARDEHLDWQKMLALPNVDRILSNAISFLDARGMWFHLPVCLTLLVNRPDECVDLLSSLGPFHFEAHQLLSEVQRQCVRDVREYVLNRVDEFSRSHFGGTQNAYWNINATEEMRLNLHIQKLESLGSMSEITQSIEILQEDPPSKSR